MLFAPEKSIEIPLITAAAFLIRKFIALAFIGRLMMFIMCHDDNDNKKH